MIKVKAVKNLIGSQGPIRLEVDFTIENREFVTLFGPSGAGKTTVLRMIAGLTRPDEGWIHVDDEVWFDSRKNIDKPVQQRQISFVFQDYNLFPNMTVRENLQYALHGPHDQPLVDELLAMVHLTELQHRKPDVLSGGQKQRVALARALLRKPKIFLLDEPLSALDRDMRAKLQDEMEAIYQRFKIPTLFVTHDPGEIVKLAHHIFVLEQGRIVRSGHPRDVLRGEGLSDDVRWAGDILALEKDKSRIVVTVQIGDNITQVVATEDEARPWRVGDRVFVAAKMMNPVIVKNFHPRPGR